MHVCSQLRLERVSSLAGNSNARITQIVIRLDTIVLQAGDPTYSDRLGFIEDRIRLLPYLQAVTLETIQEDESAELAVKLPMLRSSGKLRRRTCEEARTIAQDALRSSSGDSEIKGVVSPFWYSDEYKDKGRELWCANVF